MVAQPRRWRHAFTGACVAVFGLIQVSACSVVATSPVYDPTSAYFPEVDHKCESTVGSYTLPKTKLLLTVVQNTATGVSVLRDITDIKVADDPQRYSFCLDFMENWFADDKIQVRRTGLATLSDTSSINAVRNRASSGLLNLVASHSVDMSGVILTKVIRAIFIYLSGGNGYITGRSATDVSTSEWSTVLEPSIDPFDAASVAQWNKSLRRYGFCLAVDDYSYDSAIDAARYCDNPVEIEAAHPSPKMAGAQAIRDASIRQIEGLYYRPRIAYPVTIFVNPDPQGRGEWRIGKTVYIEMENISPVLALRINRAMFAQKKTAVIFDNGRLKTVCLLKGSEIKGAITPVLELVSDLVQLPSATISAEIALINKSQEVYAAEKSVIDMQNRLIQLRQAQLERNAAKITELAGQNTASAKDGSVLGKTDGAPVSTLPEVPEPTTAVSTAEIDDICKGLKASDDKFSTYFGASFNNFENQPQSGG
jgi:hypothetical protein